MGRFGLSIGRSVGVGGARPGAAGAADRRLAGEAVLAILDDAEASEREGVARAP